MRIAALLMVLVAVAGPVCGAWERTTAVAGGATPSRALLPYRLVTGDVSVVPVLVTGLLATPMAGDVAEYGWVAGGGNALGVGGLHGATAIAEWGAGRPVGWMPECPAFGDAGVCASMNTDRVRAYKAAQGMERYEVDPFLSPVDIWDDGPLGELRRAANLARMRGDEGAYDQAAREYWRTVSAAMARREVFEGRGERESK
jgi:hypothetical protein